MDTRYFPLLFLILSIKLAFMVFIILYSGIGLGPDEAQYWTWSRQIDWGYYSKPPGIAWEIGLSTYLLGNTEIGVRTIPLLLGTLMPMIVYYMAKCCRLNPRTCFWAGMMMALTPLGILNSFLAITDGGMMLFWMIACIHLTASIEKQEHPNYLILGILIALGALFKWPIYFLWVFILAAWVPFKSMKSRQVIPGLLISLMGIVPSLYWNMTHEWATFRHVAATGGAGNEYSLAQKGAHVMGFIGSQLGLLSPILFILLIIAFWNMWKQRKTISKGVLFCGGISLAAITAAIFASMVMKIQGNWVIFAYATAFVLLSWYVFEFPEKMRKRWFGWGLAFSVMITGLIFAIPSIQSHDTLTNFPIPYRINPFRHNIGWSQLKTALNDAGYDSNNNFIFSHTYQTTSILSFYGDQQKPAYFFNLEGRRKNQFSFWPGMAESVKGKTGYFVAVENSIKSHEDESNLVNSLKNQLTLYFNEIHFQGSFPLFFAYGKPVKVALIFKCSDYNGDVPQETFLY